MSATKTQNHDTIEAGMRTMPVERPILFSTDMVKAILDGRKTQTRRVVKNQSDCNCFNQGHDWELKEMLAMCKYGKPGDLLWVRESFVNTFIPHTTPIGGIVYKADHTEDKSLRYKPSIHMPKSYARIWMQVEEIGVERLHDISEEDAKAEGVKSVKFHSSENFVFEDYTYYTKKPLTTNRCFNNAKDSFKSLWHSISGRESYDSNPWVWVIKFKVLSTTGKPSTL